MNSIKSRVEKMEKKLNMGEEGTFIVLTSDEREQVLPEPLEEWITYKEAKEKCGQLGIFVADPAAELEARERLQRETEGNKKAKNE